MRPRFPFLPSAAVFRKVIWLLLAFHLVGKDAAAQTAFYVEHAGAMRLVRQVKQVVPYVEWQGKMVPVKGEQAILNPAMDYLPFCVEIRELKGTFVTTTFGNVPTHFEFEAVFESPVGCENAFLVMEVRPQVGARLGAPFLFCYEIGRLRTGIPQRVKGIVGVQGWFGEGAQSTAHVFSDGIEAMNSMQSAEYRAQAMTAAIARRVVGVHQANPKLWAGFPPRYPDILLQSKITGEATVLFRITRDGFVRDPVLKSATQPAFGEAALAAVKKWRFLPKMEQGEAVETMVEFPFKFSPPENNAK